ncbi:MAG TPA: 3'-5' exonuclease [Patescibacteria group bacterium]|nr:3'-5' exonuclease [Patescibacteria group bacterium]
MNFKKDILLIDTEFSGLDPKRHDLLQLAAVLLDRKTLKEKSYFCSYVRPQHWAQRDRASMAVNRIAFSQVRAAPTPAEVIRSFDRQFGHNIILAFYVGFNDKRFLLKAYREAGVNWRFDYHSFDLWGFFYAFLAGRNGLKSRKDFAGFGLESLMKKYKIKTGSGRLHDALVDCRAEAEVLRRVMADLSAQ